MKIRVIIEYVLPPGDSVVLRDREEQRWITSETVLALPGSAMVKVEPLDGPLLSAVAPLSRRARQCAASKAMLPEFVTRIVARKV